MQKASNKYETKDNIYQFIVDYVTENLFSPSLLEIADGVGVTTNDVKFHLDNLEEEGKIQRVNSSRGIKLVGYRLVKVGISGYKDKVRQGLLELQV